MKKLLLSIAFLAIVFSVNSQTSNYGGYSNYGAPSASAAKSKTVTYGASSGFNNLSMEVTENMRVASSDMLNPFGISNKDVGVSASMPGIFVGVFADIQISETFYVKPELQYMGSFADGEVSSFLTLPIMGKYYVDRKLNVQAGPFLSFILDKLPSTWRKFAFGLSAGLGYDISKKVFATAKYSLGLTNMVDRSKFSTGVSPSVKMNIFQMGLGYRF